MVTENGEETRSHLIIKNARATDSGPSIFQTATVRLHVLHGEREIERVRQRGRKERGNFQS